MSISKEEVMYVADLARLSFSPDEIERLERELSAVLDYAAVLDTCDTENVRPTEHILPLKNVYRKDVVHESLPVEEALRNAPDSELGGFKVPKVIE